MEWQLLASKWLGSVFEDPLDWYINDLEKQNAYTCSQEILGLEPQRQRRII